MRILCALPFLLAGVLWADQAADRRAIEDVIERLNSAAERPALFVSGADVPTELHRLARVRCGLLESKPWSETFSPGFTRPAVQFIGPDVAVADTEYRAYSSLVSVHTPVVVILRRERGEWKIATVRVPAECPGAPRIVPANR